MKKKLLSLIFSLVVVLAFATKPHTDKVRINSKNSTITWTGSKVSESHTGTVNISKGYLAINHGILVGGQISIDMNTISTTDMNKKLNQKLDSHLKNEDFFNVKQYPYAKINIRKAVTKKKGSGSYKILADLTIKGITHSVEFIADVKVDGLNFLAKANIKIDRTKWGVEYNSGSVVQDLGDKLILDEIELDIFLLSAK